MVALASFASALIGAAATITAVFVAENLRRARDSRRFLISLKNEIRSILELLRTIKSRPSEHRDTVDKKKYGFSYYAIPQKYAPVYLTNAALSGIASVELSERISEFYSKLLNMNIVAWSSIQVGTDIPYVGTDDLIEVERRAERALEAIDRNLKGK